MELLLKSKEKGIFRRDASSTCSTKEKNNHRHSEWEEFKESLESRIQRLVIQMIVFNALSESFFIRDVDVVQIPSSYCDQRVSRSI